MDKMIEGIVRETASGLDKLFTTEEEKLLAQNGTTKILANLKIKMEEFKIQLINSTKQTVLDEVNGDVWQRRWRPILMYLFMAVIGFFCLVIPFCLVFGLVKGQNVNLMINYLELNPVPTDVWSLLKIGLGGYIGGRSVEKVARTIFNSDKLGKMFGK